MSVLVWSNTRSYGESSRDSHTSSHTPSGVMRYTAPFGERRSSRVDPDPVEPAPTSTIEIDVISADTVGVSWRVVSGGVMDTALSPLDPPDDPRPLIAAT